jgi:hypothetical protein
MIFLIKKMVLCMVVGACATLYAVRRAPSLGDARRRPLSTFARCWLPTILCGAGATLLTMAVGRAVDR